jgi:HipA-like protein
MRNLSIFFNKVLAGVLTEVHTKEYVFCYDEAYFADMSKPAISLTLPKNQQIHKSKYIFPVFSNMIAEGANRNLQKMVYKIADDDVISFLIYTAQYDTIGAITIQPYENK